MSTMLKTLMGPRGTLLHPVKLGQAPMPAVLVDEVEEWQSLVVHLKDETERYKMDHHGHAPSLTNSDVAIHRHPQILPGFVLGIPRATADGGPVFALFDEEGSSEVCRNYKLVPFWTLPTEGEKDSRENRYTRVANGMPSDLLRSITEANVTANIPEPKCYLEVDNSGHLYCSVGSCTGAHGCYLVGSGDTAYCACG